MKKINELMARLFLLLLLFVNSNLIAQNQNYQFLINDKAHSARINQCLFINKGEEFLTVSDDKSLGIWNFNENAISKKYYPEIKKGNIGKLNVVEATADGKVIFFGGNTVNELKEFGFYTLNRKKGETFFVKGHRSTITALTLSSNQKYLASGSADSTIIIWEVKAYDQIVKLFEYKFANAVSDIDFAYGQNLIAVAFNNKNISLLNLGEGCSSLIKIKNIEKHFLPAGCVKFSPDSAFLVSGGDDYWINLYSTQGDFIKRIHKAKQGISSLDFSRDGKLLLAGTKVIGNVDVVSIPDGKLLQRYSEFDNTIQSVCFSPESENGIYYVLASGGTYHQLKIFNAINGKTLKNFGQHTKYPSNIYFKDNHSICFNFKPEEKLLNFEFDLNNIVLVKNISETFVGHKNEIDHQLLNAYTLEINSRQIKNDKHSDGRVLCLSKISNEKLIVGSDFSLKFYDFKNNDTIEMMYHSGSLRSLAVSPDSQWVASSGEDEIINLWRLSNGVPDTIPFLSFFVQESGEWLCWSREGYFAGSQDAEDLLVWQNYRRVNVKPIVTEASSFSNLLYRPDLLIKSFQEKKNINEILVSNKESIVDISRLERASPPQFRQPWVKFGGVTRELIEKSSDVFVIDTTEVVLSVEVTYGGGGIKELNLFQNDKLIIIDKDFTLTNYKDKIVKEYNIRLLPGLNTFKVNTLNNKNMRSISDNIGVECKSDVAPVSDLYMLIIGINEYQNSSMNLNYGVPDALSLQENIKERSKNIFSNIYTYTLLNSDATLPKIKEAISEIRSKSKLSDVFIMYYAGHGVIISNDDSGENEFYMVMHDITNLNEEEVAEKGLSSTDFRTLLSEINASKQLVLLDACHSEASFNNNVGRRGLAEQQAILQLARSSGSVIIAACGSNQTAKEFKELGHGAFTYSLIEALNGKADGGVKDKKITVNEIKAYIEDRVPQLTQKYSGTAQYPSGYSIGQDFPIVISE